MGKPSEKKHQPGGQYVSVIVHVRDWSEDGYGTLSFRLPVADICWDNADRPKSEIVLEDIYEVDLNLEASEAAAPDAHGLESDTWDRDTIQHTPKPGHGR